MDYNSDPMPRFSPTANTLWILVVVFAGFLLALELWMWACKGHSWTTLFSPVGILFLFFSYRIAKSRGKLALALFVIAMGLLSVDLIYTLTSLR